MADVVDAATRSRMMAGIRDKDTTPELALRRRLHAEGLRYRLHPRNVSGRPDIVLPARKVAIFVHGCFWHRHEGCHWCTTPASNTPFWTEKFSRNKARDRQVAASLRDEGWRVAIVWECGLRAAGIDETIAELLAWMRSDEPVYESRMMRVRGPSR